MTSRWHRVGTARADGNLRQLNLRGPCMGVAGDDESTARSNHRECLMVHHSVVCGTVFTHLRNQVCRLPPAIFALPVHQRMHTCDCLTQAVALYRDVARGESARAPSAINAAGVSFSGINFIELFSEARAPPAGGGSNPHTLAGATASVTLSCTPIKVERCPTTDAGLFSDAQREGVSFADNKLCVRVDDDSTLCVELVEVSAATLASVAVVASGAGNGTAVSDGAGTANGGVGGAGVTDNGERSAEAAGAESRAWSLQLAQLLMRDSQRTHYATSECGVAVVPCVPLPYFVLVVLPRSRQANCPTP